MFDALNGAHLRTGAALMLPGAGDAGGTGRPVFALGSGGLSYGLGACSSGAGTAFREDHGAPLAPAGKVLGVSGSCAARTAMQIRWALGHVVSLALRHTDVRRVIVAGVTPPAG